MCRTPCRSNKKSPEKSAVRATISKEPKSSRPRTRASAELIEQTRHLMEQTIEFVAHPLFETSDGIDQILAIRPGTLDLAEDFVQPKPAIAFVSGLVQTPLLTAEEERFLFTWMNFVKSRAERNRRELNLNRPDQSLVKAINADLEEAIRVRNHIVQGNLRLIVALAKKLAGSIEQMSDLIGEGMNPLIRSVELFDISMGNRFSTYATWAVRNQMLRWLKRVRSTRETSPGEDAPSLENLPDRRPILESTDSNPQIRMDAVNRLLSSLSEREKSIIVARFGLDGQPRGQSLADIAEQVGLSKERVRQIVLVSLSKLRVLMTYDEFESMS